MDDLYSEPRHPEAVDLWACFFAESKEQIEYSNWRHLNNRRLAIEDRTWRKLIKPRSRVLDIGCGRGFFLKRLYQNFGPDIEYFGLDISTMVVKHAQDYFDRPEYFVSAGEALPFREPFFNYVQIISTLEHVRDPAPVLKEAYRVLKPEGFLYLVIHKRHLDPLLISTLYNKSGRIARKAVGFKEEGEDECHYCQPLSGVRSSVFNTTRELGLEMVDRGDLVPHLDVDFYLKLGLSLQALLKVLTLVNALPLSIFKNLEYLAFRK